MHGACRPEKSRKDLDDDQKQRQALRERLLAARAALSPEHLEERSQRIRDHLERAFPQLATQTVAFCWPFRNEPDLRPLIARWYAAGHPGFQALLPVVVGPGQALVFRAWRPGDLMQEDRYGIPTPVEGIEFMPESLLIPVNAFDQHGYRLGYGGGFFDRTLAALAPRPLTIGIGFEEARVDTIFPQAHDMRLDAVVTETGLSPINQA